MTMRAATGAANAPARMDPQMRAHLDRMAAETAGGPDPLTAPIEEARATTEAAQMPLAEGGPEMVRVDERWIPVGGRNILVRINYPSDRRPLPVLVYLHGGGWVFNSIYTHDRLAREYAARAGIAVLSPDYSLAPEYKFPLALNECVAVVRWLARNGESWGLDPKRIAIGGDSAGGNLSLAACLVLRDADEDLVRGALLNYAVLDSNSDTAAYARYGQGEYPLSRQRMEFFWNHYLPGPEQRSDPLAAPLKADFAGLPPLRFQVAEMDALTDENVAAARKAAAAGVDQECEIYPGVVHGFMRALAHIDAGERAANDAATWLRRILVD